MKKLCWLMLAIAPVAFAQETPQTPDTPSALASRRNEVRVDLVSLIALSKYNLTYERYFDSKFSVGASFNYANSNKVTEDFDQGNRDNAPKYEITPFVRYRFSESLARFYFAELFVSANGGDFREIVRKTDGSVGYYEIEKSTYSDVAIGGGLGYKMYIKERVAIELLVGFGANTMNTDKSPDVFSRVGLSVGYRF